jgi:F-type H+-transporting ATPase subunit a
VKESVNFLQLIGDGKVPEVLVGTWLVMGILIVLALIARRALRRAEDPVMPDEGISVRSICETVVEWLDVFVHDVTEISDYRPMVSFFGSLFLFILFCNFLGLVPGMEPPTGDSDLTFGLGAVCFVYFIVQGFRAHGLRYLRSFLGPYLPLAFLMLPIEVADNVFRPFSLGLRLFANMFADHHLLGIFTNLTKLVVPLLFYALGSIVCVIQALIFMVLAVAYVRLSAGEEH